MVILSGILWSGTGEAGLGMGQGGLAGQQRVWILELLPSSEASCIKLGHDPAHKVLLMTNETRDNSVELSVMQALEVLEAEWYSLGSEAYNP